jgi:hypothetical protein
MSEDGPWLNVPQAVVLEATRDIDLALDLTEDDPVLLVIKANQRIALRTVIPLEEDADNEQRRDAFRRLREQRTAVHGDNCYQEAQQQLHRRLFAGVGIKASRTPGGPCESVDVVELTRVELRGVDAIDKRTEAVMLYDLRINGFDLIEHFCGRLPARLTPIRAKNTTKCISLHRRRARNGIAPAIRCRSSSSGPSQDGVKTSRSCPAV